MKEIFINKTKCSKKEYNMFIKAHDKEFGFKEDLFLILYAVFGIWLLINIVINKLYVLGLFWIIISVVFLGYKIVGPNLVLKKELKSQKIQNAEVNAYIFYKYCFKVKNKQGQSTIFYYKIHKVLENSTHFYIYLGKTRALVLSKQGFIKGESQDFAKFLRKRVWFRYKNKKTNS